MKKLLLSAVLPVFMVAGNLSNLIELAHKNETAQIAQARLQQSRMNRDSLLRGYYPYVNLGGSYTHLSDTSSQKPDRTATAYASIGATLYDGGKRESALDQYGALVQSSQASEENTRESLALQTLQAYFSELTVQSSITAKVREIEQLKAELKHLERFERVGSASKDEVEKIRAQVALGEAELAELDLSLRQANVNLQKLTGSPQGIEPGSYVLEPQSDEKGDRPDIRALTHQADSAKEAIGVQRSTTLPSLSIEDQLSRSNYSFEDGEPATWDQPDNVNQLTLSLNWKVFDFGSTSKAVESARLNHLISEKNLAYETRAAELDRSYAYEALAISRDQIRASQARLKSAEITFEAIRKKFRAGVVDNVTYLSALSDKYDAEAALIQTKNNYEIKKAQYWNVSGIPLMEKIK